MKEEKGVTQDVDLTAEDLKELADANLHAAQTKLMDILSNYQGFKKCTLILVFDAYKIEGHAEEVITYHNIHVVYTKEAETADQYIEKTVHKIGRENQVTTGRFSMKSSSPLLYPLRIALLSSRSANLIVSGPRFS